MFSRKRFIILITLILLGTLLLDNAKPKIVNAIIPSSWTKTGGPIGGLGYDVRYGASSDGILDTSVMYVTDNYSGVNKSTGGITWDTTHINNGLTDLYIGSLVMHPTNPNILLAGAGNNSCSYLPDGSSTGGVFLSENGGETWTKTLSNDAIISVEFSPSNPNIAYAGSKFRFYRSENGGHTWEIVAGGPYSWGPPGVIAGFPIDILVDPTHPTHSLPIITGVAM